MLVSSRPCRNNSIRGSTLSSIREHFPLPLPRAARALALRHQFSLLAGLELFRATRPAVHSRLQVYIHFTLVSRCTPHPNCGCFARALILGMLWTPASDSRPLGPQSRCLVSRLPPLGWQRQSLPPAYPSRFPSSSGFRPTIPHGDSSSLVLWEEAVSVSSCLPDGPPQEGDSGPSSPSLPVVPALEKGVGGVGSPDEAFSNSGSCNVHVSIHP